MPFVFDAKSIIKKNIKTGQICSNKNVIAAVLKAWAAAASLRDSASHANIMCVLSSDSQCKHHIHKLKDIMQIMSQCIILCCRLRRTGTPMAANLCWR